MDEDDGGLGMFTATYQIQQWLTNCLSQGDLDLVKHKDWHTREVSGALHVYQLDSLI